MNQTTQVEFARVVEMYYQRYRTGLNLSSPRFKYEGFISQATMDGPDGFVEIRCCPPEYHAEIFINSFGDKRRWTLADLIVIPGVREWLISNRPNTVGRSHLEAEIELAFRLLTEGLRGVPNFEWLHARANGHDSTSRDANKSV